MSEDDAEVSHLDLAIPEIKLSTELQLNDAIPASLRELTEDILPHNFQYLQSEKTVIFQGNQFYKPINK